MNQYDPIVLEDGSHDPNCLCEECQGQNITCVRCGRSCNPTEIVWGSSVCSDCWGSTTSTQPE